MTEDLEINEENRRYLLANAENVVFVDGKETVDKYKCLNCDKIAIKHHLANCKHIFCSNCMKELYYKSCPSCNVEIVEVIRDARIEKGLLELNVECLFKKHGCQEVVPLYKYQEHNETCQMSTKDLLSKLYRGKSPNEKLQELEDDLQTTKLDIKEIREEQLKIASKNFEKLEAIQEDINKLKTIRKDHEKLKTRHHDAEQLIHQLKEEMEARFLKITKQQTDCNFNDEEQNLKLQDKTGSTIDPDESFHHGIALLCKFNGVNEKWKNLKSPFLNQETPIQSQFRSSVRHRKTIPYIIQRCHDIGLGLQFSVLLRFTEAYITIELCEFQYACNTFFSHSRKFTLIDQSEHADKSNVSFVDAPLFNRNLDFTQQRFRNNILIPVILLEKHFDTFVKDDSLLIEIRFIPLVLMYKSMASSNGTLLWRIDNYSKKKQSEIDGIQQCLISEPFYTSPQGYRVLASLHLNGFDLMKGRSISIYVDFVKGEFDNWLPCPFTAMAKFFLRDQSSSSNRQHRYKEIAFSHIEGGPHHGIANFVPWNQAEEPRYLKEDALLFKIMIQIV